MMGRRATSTPWSYTGMRRSRSLKCGRTWGCGLKIEMTQISVISVRSATVWSVPHDAQLIFADHVGRFYARQ